MMILVALLIGALLIVAAVRNSQGALWSALTRDVPGFVVWAAAILAIGAIGFAPGLKPISRGLLALVVLVIVVNNYKEILAGFGQVAQPSGGVQVKDSSKASNDNAGSDPFGSIGTLMENYATQIGGSIASGASSAGGP